MPAIKMQCCVCLRERISSDTSADITFHKWPSARSVRTAWLQALGKQQSCLPRGALVCSQHFLAEDFSETRSGLKKLRPGAVPFVINDLSNLNQIPIEISVPENFDSIVIKNGENQSMFLMNDRKLLKQSPGECYSDRKETWLNVHDTLFDVVKQELCDNSSEIQQYRDNTAVKKEPSQAGTSFSIDKTTLGTFLVKNIEYEHVGVEEASALEGNPFDAQAQQALNSDRVLASAPPAANTGGTVLQCGYCHYTTVYKSNLARHTSTHMKEKLLQCHQCQYTTMNNSLLARHIRTHNKNYPFTCKVCNYKSASCRRDLDRHLRTHTGEKPYKCNICTHKFTQAAHLRVHMRVHTGDKPYLCKYCSYSCYTASCLRVHERTHSRDKPYMCQQCNYKCSVERYLRFHIRSIHNKERPYVCKHCNYKCSKSHHLTVHMRIHTGEKPYSCDVCDYKCAHKKTLVAHMKKHIVPEG